MVDFSQFNIFKSIGIGTIGLSLLILVLAVFFCVMFGFGLWYFLRRRQLKYTIPLYRKVGGRTIRVATYKARDLKIGMAGDKLWYVPKVKKYIPVATLQTGINEYTHFEREDGEWINIDFPDIDENMKKMGVKYINQDMRAQRIAIGNIVEQRFKGKKGFWEQYGHLVTHVIFYLIVAVAMVIIFYQFSTIIDKLGALFDKVVAYEIKKCPSQQGVVPALIPLILWRFKKWGK